MAEVVTFIGYRPPPRYDSIPWTEARIEEASSEDGTFVELETIPLTPVDADPSLPASRSFTTELGTAVDYWYRIVWVDATADTSVPTTPVHNTSGAAITVEPYATVAELATILQVNATSNAAALERVLVAAAGEINSETGRTDLAGWELELAAQVNLARAEELWRQMKAPWGLVGLDSDLGPTHIARDTFARHAHALAPLKREWGIA